MQIQYFVMLTKQLALVICTSILWSSVPLDVQGQDLQHHYQQGMECCQQRKYQECLMHFTAANQLRPNHQIIMYHLARAYSLNAKTDSSEKYLKKAISIKADLNLQDSAFTNLYKKYGMEGFQRLQEQLMAPVNRSDTVLRLTDRTLHLESIAYDPITSNLYLGSVRKRKIIQVDLANLVISDFIEPAAFGICSVFGMQVDAKRRFLWVCSVATEQMVQSDSAKINTAALYQFDLDSGTMIQKFTLNDGKEHWFGDLTLTTTGDVFVSDSHANSVYHLAADGDRLELFYNSPEFVSLQGLDLSSDEKVLFLADYVKGPYSINLESKEAASISSRLKHISLKSIDGLYFHSNSLITTQNLVVPMRVTQYFLNHELDTIVDFRYLEKSNALLNEPTLGVIIDNWFYYVANSQWGGYDEQHQPKPHDELQDIYIMKAKLD